MIIFIVHLVLDSDTFSIVNMTEVVFGEGERMNGQSKEYYFLPTMFDHLQMPGKTSEDWKKYQKGQYREETLPTDGTRSHCFLSIMSRFQHLTQSMHLRRIEMWPTSTSYSYSHNNLKTYLLQNCFSP